MGTDYTGSCIVVLMGTDYTGSCNSGVNWHWLHM